MADHHVPREDEMLVTSGGDRIGHSLHRAEDPVSNNSSANQRLSTMAIVDSRRAVEHPNLAHDHHTQSTINGVVRASAAECSNAKKRKKSDILDHFTEDTPNNKANCNYCGKSLIHTSNYGTSSLQKHSKKCRAKTGTEIIATKFDQAQIRVDISRYIVMCGVPFSTVEHPAFRAMLKNLQPEFMPNNGRAALKDVMQLYNKKKKILQDDMLKAKGRISLAVSTSTWGVENFMIISAHYTDDEWELKDKVLNVIQRTLIECDWDKIQRNLIEWGITDKLFSVLLDSYARADDIPSAFKEQYEPSLPLEGRFFLIGCSSFDIYDIMKRFLKSDSISRINDAIDFVSSSSERQNLFREFQRSVSLDKMHMRLHRINTLQHEDMKLVIHYKNAFTRFNLVENFKHPPTEEDWSVVTELCNFQKKFFDSEGMLAESSTSKADFHLYRLCMFGSQFRKDWVSSLTKEIMEQVNFGRNWDDCCIMLSIVVAFDPRRKLDFVKFCFSKAYGETAAKFSLFPNSLFVKRIV